MSDIPPDISHDQYAVRLKKLQDMRAAGSDPFRANATQTHFSGEALKAYVDGADYTVPVKVAGRLVVIRDMGKSQFVKILDQQGQIQLYIKKDVVGEEAYLAFKKLDLGKQQLAVLVHSGSRGLGESVLCAHVDQHFGDGVEADSFAAEEYLRGHDLAVLWAKANRELIARRFVATLGAEVECLWDGCHNSITPSDGRRRREESLTDRVNSVAPIVGDEVSLLTSSPTFIHRKGAVDADAEFVVIPGSRGSLSYVVKPTGEGASRSRASYRTTIRSQSVLSTDAATAWHSAIAAWTPYGPSTRPTFCAVATAA